MRLARDMRVVALLLTTVLAGACGGGDDGSSSPTAPSTGSAPFSQTDLRVGTGAEAVGGRTLRVNYALWLYDPGQPDNKGRQIEANLHSFTLGAGAVIRGWDQGLVGMRVGGQRRLVIPPELAYGARGNGPIPPNATIVFDVELLDVQ
jgi:FKBP-type peptidyl-prolyl cis-trans isomerase FkpA